MLYFSQAKASLETLDIEEYARLREFKRKAYPKGLIEGYTTLSDFREKLQRQLAIRIRDIIAESTQEQSSAVIDGRSIVLTFAQGNPPAVLSSNVLKLANVICTDKDEIPDYDLVDTEPGPYRKSGITIGSPNYDYYREIVAYYRQRALRTELRLAVSNLSDRSVRDIYMEIRVRAQQSNIYINPPALSIPNRSDGGTYMSSISQRETFMQSQGQVVVEKISEDEWRMEANIPVIQAQRTVFTFNTFTLAATEDSQVSFDATVYSSDALPFPLNAQLDVHLEPHETSYNEILKQILPGEF